MDSYNLQSTEDQLNSIGTEADDQANFISQYNADQVQNYKTNLNNLETKWGTDDSRTLEEFGAYSLHLGDASKRLYDASKAGFSAGDSLLNPVTAYAKGKGFVKGATNLPGKLLSKVPVNDVSTARQEVSTADQTAEAPSRPLDPDIDEPIPEDEPSTAIVPANQTPNPNPAESDAGTGTETGTSTGTETAGAVDATEEATEGVTNTTRIGKLGASVSEGLGVAGKVGMAGAKVAGTVASGVFLGMDISKQISSGKFFYGDDTAQNVGNTANEIGSAMDVIGVATGDPLLVALGVGASAIGGIVSGIDELFEHKKKEKSPQEIKQENLQKAQTIQASTVDTNLAGSGALAQSSTSTLR